MVEHMSLSMTRYAIMWNLERLELRIDMLRNIVEKQPRLKPLITDLLLSYYDYIKSLRIHQ